MKKWLIDRFLPMWAKETVLRDNHRLQREIRRLRRENEKLSWYVRGIHLGLGRGRRIGGNNEAS